MSINVEQLIGYRLSPEDSNLQPKSVHIFNSHEDYSEAFNRAVYRTSPQALKAVRESRANGSSPLFELLTQPLSVRDEFGGNTIIESEYGARLTIPEHGVLQFVKNPITGTEDVESIFSSKPSEVKQRIADVLTVLKQVINDPKISVGSTGKTIRLEAEMCVNAALEMLEEMSNPDCEFDDGIPASVSSWRKKIASIFAVGPLMLNAIVGGSFESNNKQVDYSSIPSSTVENIPNKNEFNPAAVVRELLNYRLEVVGQTGIDQVSPPETSQDGGVVNPNLHPPSTEVAVLKGGSIQRYYPNSLVENRAGFSTESGEAIASFIGVDGHTWYLLTSGVWVAGVNVRDINQDAETNKLVDLSLINDPKGLLEKLLNMDTGPNADPNNSKNPGYIAKLNWLKNTLPDGVFERLDLTALDADSLVLLTNEDFQDPETGILYEKGTALVVVNYPEDNIMVPAMITAGQILGPGSNGEFTTVSGEPGLLAIIENGKVAGYVDYYAATRALYENLYNATDHFTDLRNLDVPEGLSINIARVDGKIMPILVGPRNIPLAIINLEDPANPFSQIQLSQEARALGLVEADILEYIRNGNIDELLVLLGIIPSTEVVLEWTQNTYDRLPAELKILADSGEIIFDAEYRGYTRINPTTGEKEVWRPKMTEDDSDIEAGWLVRHDTFEIESIGTRIHLEFNPERMKNRSVGSGYKGIKFTESFKQSFEQRWLNKHANEEFFDREIIFQITPEMRIGDDNLESLIESVDNNKRIMLFGISNKEATNEAQVIRVFTTSNIVVQQYETDSQLISRAIGYAILVQNNESLWGKARQIFTQFGITGNSPRPGLSRQEFDELFSLVGEDGNIVTVEY